MTKKTPEVMSIKDAVMAERRLARSFGELGLAGHWVAVRNHELVASDISLHALTEGGAHRRLPIFEDPDNPTSPHNGVNEKTDTIFRVLPDLDFF